MNRCVALMMASTLTVVLACNRIPERPSQGVERGQCYPNRTCNDDLTCDSSNICVRSSGSGGADGSGGDRGSGGDEGRGGSDGSGGDQGSGGSEGSGGMSGSGGDQASGGSQGSGGASAAGGSQGSGGSTGAGGNECNAEAPSDSVIFCKGKAVGVMSGYGWVALGSADSLSDPTCDTAKAAITASAPCKANTNWSKTDALCMSGQVPALPEEPTDTDYADNWGIQIGVDAKSPKAAMGGESYKTITLSLTGSPSVGLRAVVHRSGDPDSTSYCADALTPGKPMPLSSFNTKCWDSSGDDLADADVPNLDKVSVQVTSGEAAVTVTDLCLSKIEFGK
jgi:hypothetical protein